MEIVFVQRWMEIFLQLYLQVRLSSYYYNLHYLQIYKNSLDLEK